VRENFGEIDLHQGCALILQFNNQRFINVNEYVNREALVEMVNTVKSTITMNIKEEYRYEQSA